MGQCDMQHIVSVWYENTPMLEQDIKWLSHHVVYVQYEISTRCQKNQYTSFLNLGGFAKCDE